LLVCTRGRPSFSHGIKQADESGDIVFEPTIYSIDRAFQGKYRFGKTNGQAEIRPVINVKKSSLTPNPYLVAKNNELFLG
jgi:hypothetical protein